MNGQGVGCHRWLSDFAAAARGVRRAASDRAAAAVDGPRRCARRSERGRKARAGCGRKWACRRQEMHDLVLTGAFFVYAASFDTSHCQHPCMQMSWQALSDSVSYTPHAVA
eukprot:95741-Pleurochrysis_carterae.AAC.2